MQAVLAMLKKPEQELGGHKRSSLSEKLAEENYLEHWFARERAWDRDMVGG
jgi:hypothetical protein